MFKITKIVSTGNEFAILDLIVNFIELSMYKFIHVHFTLISILFRKEFFIYKPEKLEWANKFGIPSLHLMDFMLEKYSKSNTWPFVTVVWTERRKRRFC